MESRQVIVLLAGAAAAALVFIAALIGQKSRAGLDFALILSCTMGAGFSIVVVTTFLGTGSGGFVVSVLVGTGIFFLGRWILEKFLSW
jgi:hypothetical protein